MAPLMPAQHASGESHGEGRWREGVLIGVERDDDIGSRLGLHLHRDAVNVIEVIPPHNEVVPGRRATPGAFVSRKANHVKAFLQVGEDVVLDHDAIQVSLEQDPIAETALIVINGHHRRTGRRITEGVVGDGGVADRPSLGSVEIDPHVRPLLVVGGKVGELTMGDGDT